MIRSLLATALLAAPALAQDGPALSVQLNALDDVGGACRLVFVATNGLAEDLSSVVLEAVAFDAGGGVAQMALFDFGALPVGLPRVRQFDMAGMSCAGIGRVLVNGVQTCSGVEACPLAVSSRTDVEFLG